MIFGVGIDIVDLPRFAKIIAKHGARMKKTGAHAVDLESEPRKATRSRQVEYWAGRFAAKEAVAKALGSGFGKNFSPADVGIRKTSSGSPELVFKAHLKSRLKKLGITGSMISITHTPTTAAAVVVFECTHRRGKKQ